MALAWKNLTHDKGRLALAIAGIAFAVMLMFQQRGFNHALFDSTVELVRQLDADIVIVNRARFALTSEQRFDRSILERVASEPGVASAEPVYFENAFAYIRVEGQRARPIRVIAFDFSKKIFLDSSFEVSRWTTQLVQPGSAIIDRLSKASYGFNLQPSPGSVQFGELAGKEVRVVGTFSLGRDFAHEGNIIMSVANFVNYFGYRAHDPASVVDLGAVRVSAGRLADDVLLSLEPKLGPQVVAMTKQQFINREIDFWANSTPIGIIFAVGAVMGFVVGVIICYQILATDISDHLREFATLKAMGYRNYFFIGLVLTQAGLLAAFGFIPGLIASWVVFRFNSAFTGLMMEITWDRALFILVLTLGMCVISGILAVRKLLNADPASLF